MNDSPYGLTASIWTNAEKNPESQNAFLRLVDELYTGTVFLNRRVVPGTSKRRLMDHAQVRLFGSGTRLGWGER